MGNANVVVARALPVRGTARAYATHCINQTFARVADLQVFRR